MGSVPLSAAQWKAIGRLWGELMEHPTSDVDGACAELLAALNRFVGGCGSFVTFGARIAPAAGDPLEGFRIVHTAYHGLTADLAQRRQQWWIEEGHAFDDPQTRAIIRSRGRLRSFLRQDIVDDATWSRSSQLNELFRPSGIGDRLVAGCPITPELEVFFGVDRGTRDRPFGAKERELIHAVLGGMGWLHRRIARSHGMIDARAALTPREREALLLLLSPRSEKQIAEVMGLTVRSAHQLIAAVYRKLDIHTRAELFVKLSGGG